nr:dihydropteroate synthase [Streptomyces ferrugineus]
MRLRIEAALEVGIPPGCLIIDPGLGFAKAPEHNWELVGHLPADRTTGQPCPARQRDAATPSARLSPDSPSGG